MVTLDVIKRSLRMIGVIAEGQTPSAAQGADALATLNGMVAGWEAVGVRLGLPALALADTIPLPANHDDAIAYNLAVALATEYGADVRQPVAVKADEGMTALRCMYCVVPQLLTPVELLPRRIGWRW